MRHLALSLFILGAAGPALAGSLATLTGTWQGSVSCKSTQVGGNSGFKADVSLKINQLTPTTLEVSVLANKMTIGYSGTLVPSEAKAGTGAGALVSCGISDSTEEGNSNSIESFTYKVGLDGTGSLKLNGVTVQNSTEVDLCKGSFTRTNTGPVVTSPCEPPI